MERDEDRVASLRSILEEFIPDGVVPTTESSFEKGLKELDKPVVYVLWPATIDQYDEMFFELGIYQPVQNAGYLCEKAPFPSNEDQEMNQQVPLH